MNKYREHTDYRFKLLYFFGAVFVVAGHCNGGAVPLLNNWFPYYAFHLGLFVFCSGYFYKTNVEDSILRYVLRKAKKLLVPLFVWNLFYGIFVLVLSEFGFSIGYKISLRTALSLLLLAPITNGHQFLYNMGGWFVIPLFMVETVNPIIRKIFHINSARLKELFLFFLYLLIGVIGVFLASKGYNKGWWLVAVRMMYLMPFYGLGVFYRSYLEKKDTLPNFAYFSLIFILELIIIFRYEKTPAYTPSWCNNFNDGPILPFVVGFLGIAFWLRVSRVLENSLGRGKIVNLIADNTYSIMINQFLGFMIVKTVFAVLYKYLSIFSDFSMQDYKSNLWYFYLPKGIYQFNIVYLVAGLMIPVAIQLVINRFILKVKKLRHVNKC